MPTFAEWRNSKLASWCSRRSVTANKVVPLQNAASADDPLPTDAQSYEHLQGGQIIVFSWVFFTLIIPCVSLAVDLQLTPTPTLPAQSPGLSAEKS
jgi:hypothetical protein